MVKYTTWPHSSKPLPAGSTPHSLYSFSLHSMEVGYYIYQYIVGTLFSEAVVVNILTNIHYKVQLKQST